MNDDTLTIAGKVRQWMESNRGNKFTIAEMIEELELYGKDCDAARAKVYEMARKEQLTKDKERMGHYFIHHDFEDSFLGNRKPPVKKHSKINGKKSNKKKPLTTLEKKSMEVLTPETMINLKRLKEARDAEPLDLNTVMSSVLSINEQNKILRQALEQIANILEQAGIIEHID